MHCSTRILRIFSVLSMIVLMLSCGGGTEPSGRGLADVVLTTPAGRSDGIAYLVISGGSVAGVQGRAGLQVDVEGLGTTVVHLFVIGAIQGTQTVAAVCLPRIERVSDLAPHSVVTEVAAGQQEAYVLRGDPYAYTLRFRNARSANC